MKSGLLKFIGAFEAVGDSVWFLEHRRFLLRKNSSSLHEDRAMFFNSVLSIHVGRSRKGSEVKWFD